MSLNNYLCKFLQLKLFDLLSIQNFYVQVHWSRILISISIQRYIVLSTFSQFKVYYYISLTYCLTFPQSSDTIFIIFLNFLHPGRPFHLQNCSVANQSIDSLNVECVENFDGGLPQTFLMELLELPSLIVSIGNLS